MFFCLYVIFFKMPRFLKQIIIFSAIVLILAGFITAGFFLFKENPSCFDKKQNQNETAVDCGGNCEPCEKKQLEKIKLSLLKSLSSGESNYDLVAKINNPNPNYGAKQFFYSFQIFDASDKLISEQKGESYILPRQTKYLILSNVVITEKDFKLKLTISGVDWAILEFDYPDLSIFNKKFEYGQTAEFASFGGILINKGVVKYDNAEIVLILFDENNDIVAVNRTEANNLLFNEEKPFKMIWSEPFEGKPVKFDAQTYVNPF